MCGTNCSDLAPSAVSSTALDKGTSDFSSQKPIQRKHPTGRLPATLVFLSSSCSARFVSYLRIEFVFLFIFLIITPYLWVFFGYPFLSASSLTMIDKGESNNGTEVVPLFNHSCPGASLARAIPSLWQEPYRSLES